MVFDLHLTIEELTNSSKKKDKQIATMRRNLSEKQKLIQTLDSEVLLFAPLKKKKKRKEKKSDLPSASPSP